MKRFLVISTLAFGLSALYGKARASCGAAVCPLNTHHGFSRGQLLLQLSHEYINENQINVGSKKSFVGALPNPHNEVETKNQRTLLQLQYGLSNALGINAELPFIHREHSHIEAGKTKNFNFDGFGDMVVLGHYGRTFGDIISSSRLDISAGVKLPTGRTGATNTTGDEKAEVTIQPGTGSWDGILGIDLSLPLFSLKSLTGRLYGHLPLNASVSYRLNGKGTSDYQLGKQLMTHLGTEYQIFPKFSLLFQANGRWQDFANTGTTGEFRSNTGGTWIFLSPGASFQFNHAFSAYSYAQVPVYQKVNGIQQVAKLNLQAGLSANVTLLK